MVTQKPISVKLDFGTLARLDAECNLGWRKRNGHINDAIDFYLEYRDTLRRIRSHSDLRGKIDEYNRFTRRWFTDIADIAADESIYFSGTK